MINTTNGTLRFLRAGAVVAGSALLIAACGAGEKDLETTAASSGASASGSASAAGAAAGVETAKKQMADLAGPITNWPDVAPIANPVDLKGKTVTYVALGDQIPVIHGVGVGATEALKAAGATVKICDGKFNPTAVADCLKAAGDEKVAGVITAFVDYQMAGPAFDAVAAKGIPVIVGGVAPSGGRTADKTLAFYDNTERVNKLYEAMSAAAIAEDGDQTKTLWMRLTDSTTTTGASDKGVAKFKELCPNCTVATADLQTANLDKMASAVSAALVSNPDVTSIIVPVDSFVPPAMQGIQSSGKTGKIKVHSSSSDLAGLQRVKDGQQASDLGTPVLFEGWKFANAFMQLASGEEVSKGTEFMTRNFTKANVGDLKLDAASYLTDDWFGGGAYKDKFKAAWGVS